MRCLYCGKELALLKRWTRGGQFCSEAHKKSYQEEYNRMGLSRLLQAQTKSVQAKATQHEDKAPGTTSPAVVQAPVALEEAPVEEAAKLIEAEEVVEAQAADTELAAESAEESAQETPWEPQSLAGFLTTETDQAVYLEIAPPQSEPWEPGNPTPLRPQWHSPGGLSHFLPEAALLELNFRPNLAEGEYSAPEVKVPSGEFAPSDPNPPALATIKSSNRLASRGLVKLQLAPRAFENNVTSLERFLGFPLETSYHGSMVLQLASTEIAFPSEDADVTLAPANTEIAPCEPVSEEAPSENVAEASPTGEGELPLTEATSDTDRETVRWAEEEALKSSTPENVARLHHELTDTQQEAPAPAGPEDDSRDVPGTLVEKSPPETAEPVQPEPSLRAEQPKAGEWRTPRSVTEPVEVPVKIFAPMKSIPREGAAALIQLPVFLPGLTGLPLRPKMGLAPPASLPGSKKAQPDNASAPQPSQDTRRAPELKPEERKPVADVRSKERRPARGPLPDGRPNGSSRGAPQKLPVPTPAREGPPAAAKASKPWTPPKAQPPAASKIAPAGRPEASQDAKPLVKPSEAAEVPEVLAPAQPPAIARLASSDIEAPSFGASQVQNVSWLGTLKGKLAIGGLAVALCVAGYFVFGGKPQPPAVNPAAAADTAGPSIMVGGGGWMEGWAGDPAGVHYGRQITIYRPSLKLSDYRIEFKGEIEHKSLGWVFRAADPDDYYAMKLAIVTPGAEPKIALLKYVISSGHETQVGRAPVDLNVRLDTLYSVRVDVRGPKFTTYVQGQQVDVWTDDQLKSGGVGFLNEREERGRIKTVSVSLLNGGK